MYDGLEVCEVKWASIRQQTFDGNNCGAWMCSKIEQLLGV